MSVRRSHWSSLGWVWWASFVLRLRNKGVGDSLAACGHRLHMCMQIKCRVASSSSHLWESGRTISWAVEAWAAAWPRENNKSLVALMQMLFTCTASGRVFRKSILIAESIQFNAPRSKSIICMQAESVCSLPRSAPVITLTQGLSRVKELSGGLNDPYLPTGSQQWLNWLLQSRHDPTCPAESERTTERTNEWMKEGRKGGRKGGRKEGREGGRKEGRKGRREGGREEGRKEGRERSCELLPWLCLSWLSVWFPLRWAQICNETVCVSSNVK